MNMKDILQKMLQSCHFFNFNIDLCFFSIQRSYNPWQRLSFSDMHFEFLRHTIEQGIKIQAGTELEQIHEMTIGQSFSRQRSKMLYFNFFILYNHRLRVTVLKCKIGKLRPSA